MTDQQSKMVTNHGEFWRALEGSEYRYYPSTAKEQAKEYDQLSDPDRMLGFAVYDTSISTSYAVALYAIKADADAHPVTEAPAVVTTVFEEEVVAVETPEEPIADEDSKPKKRGWGK